MLRRRSTLPGVVLALYSISGCSLIIDTNPDGVIRDAKNGGASGQSASTAGSSNGAGGSSLGGSEGGSRAGAGAAGASSGNSGGGAAGLGGDTKGGSGAAATVGGVAHAGTTGNAAGSGIGGAVASGGMGASAGSPSGGGATAGGASSQGGAISLGGTGAGGTSASAGAPGTGGSTTPALCMIGGTSYAAKALNPSNSCVSCQPAASASQWSPEADGKNCGSGMVCRAGACSAGCWIGGAYYSVGNANPGNPCQSCQPLQSSTAWSNVATARCVQALSAGGNSTCAIMNGGLYCWGGVGSTPVAVPGLTSKVTAVSVGSGGYTCAVVNQALYCWGNNVNGQLGDGSTTSRATPGPVTNLTSGVISVAAGRDHTCAIANSLGAGDVYCWGWNSEGQLGNGTTDPSYTPRMVMGSAISVAAGDEHTCAVDSSNRLYCWGYNGSGQLGNGSETSSLSRVQVTSVLGATAVTAGFFHTCAIISGGALCWGNNRLGQLGVDTAEYHSTPAQVVGLTSGVTSIATAGEGHTCAVVKGSVQCWGSNSYMQLGNGLTTTSPRPVQVTGLTSGATAVATGLTHSCAIVNGGVQCWGWNSSGQLGDGTTTNRPTPVTVTMP